MPSSHRGSSPRSSCGGRLRLRPALVLSAVLAYSLGARQRPTATAAAAHRANELTLAGLHPGRDTVSRATQLNKSISEGKTRPDGQTLWIDVCRGRTLVVDTDKTGKIEVIRVGPYAGPASGCSKLPPSPWKTGLGLHIGDEAARASQLYGPPDSKSPSTRDHQPLELWYYAFDWAGPDVPQVMEVLCTREQDGKPGRVVEITLAAPSL
jgi:hypothetical protein